MEISFNNDLTPLIIWSVTGIVCFLLEVSLPHFGLLFAGIAAFVVALISWIFPFSYLAQIFIFSLFVLSLFFFLRPKLLKKIYSSQKIPERLDSLIGKHGRVIEAIDTNTGEGRILIDGIDWACRMESSPKDQRIAVGEIMVVRSHDGIVLIVEKHLESLNTK